MNNKTVTSCRPLPSSITAFKKQSVSSVVIGMFFIFMLSSARAAEDTSASSESLVKALQRCESDSNVMELPPLPKFPILEQDWGQKFYDSHPVLRHPAGGAHTAHGQKLVQKYTIEQLVSLLPKQVPGNRYSNCPECLNNGVEYEKNGSYPNGWKWSVDQPDQLTCTTCKTVFPNEKYANNATRTYLNPAGEEIEIAFYKPSKKREEEFFLGALLDCYKDAFLRSALKQLAYAYHEAGDEKAAEAGVAILEGYAKALPHWLTYGVHSFGEKDRRYLSTGGPFLRGGKYKPHSMGADPHPYGWMEGRGPYFAWWFRSMTAEFFMAYDLLYKSDFFDGKKSPDGKTSYRFWIENNIFDNQAEFMLSFPWSGHINNNLPVHVADLTQVAMVCGRPSYARFARNWCKLVFYNYMNHHDMMTLEGPGYQSCWIAHARSTYELLAQYNDPAGYKDENGFTMSEYDPREEPAKKRQFWAASMIHLPDGTLYSIGDSGRFRSVKGILSFPLQKSVNRIAPGFGLTILGDGTLKEDNQVQAALCWNAGGHSHSHEDVNNLMLFANGRELFSDMHSGWAARMTSAHNTVTIDGKNNCGKKTPAGSLELYTPNQPGVAVVRVESKMAAYPDSDCSRYRRTIIHNTVDLDHTYVVDVFEVKGGSQHDYFLQGSSEKAYPQTGSTNLKLGPFAKPEPKNPESISGWDGFENLKASMMTQRGYVDFVFEDKPTMGTRTHFQKDESLQLILGEAPNVLYRTNGGYTKTWRKHMPTYKTVPKLILRNKGEAGLETTYVLVHEVIDGSTIVKQIKHSVNKNGVLSVAVDLGDRRDYYAIALKDPAALKCGPLTGKGGFVAAVTKNGKADLWMADATQAKCYDRTLSSEQPNWTGSLEKAVRMENGAPKDAYLTDAQLPIGDALKNEMVMLQFFDEKGAWLFNLSSEIETVLVDGNKRWVIIKQDAGLMQRADGSWEEIFWPNRTAASCQLKVISSATTVPQLKWTPARGRYDHFDTNAFIPVDTSTSLKVTSANAKGPIVIAGDLSAEGMEELEVRIDREVNVSLTALNPDGVMEPRTELLHILPQLPALSIDIATLEAGVKWSLYKGRVDLNELSTLKKEGEGVTDVISDAKPIASNKSLVFEGYLNVPASGKYTFYTRTAGGAKLVLDDRLIHSTPNFEREEEFKSEIYLEKGLHQIQFNFGHSRADGLFHLKWSADGMKKAQIPAAMLFHAPNAKE